MTPEIPAWLDNPILVKHARSRLRRAQLFPAMTIVAVLEMLLAWWGVSTNSFSSHQVFLINLIGQGIILVAIGGSQVGATVSAARESGILDFHRISPLSPWAITLGFFFGAPLLQYVLFGVTLLMGLACVASGGVTFLQFLQFVVLAVLVAWLIDAVAMLSALVAKRATKGGPIGLIVFILVMASNVFGVLASRIPQFEGELMLPFFGLDIPWLLYSTIYLLPPTGFALVACMRKIRSERARPLSKPQALAFLATAAVLILGGLWRMHGEGAVVVIVVYALTVLGVFTTLTITPTAGDYARGLRRAHRQGRRRLPFLDELSLNRATLVLLCLIVLAGSSIAWNLIEGRVDQQASYSLAIAVGVLTVAYFGLAYQFFALVAPARAGTLQALFIFLCWGVPSICVPIATAAGFPAAVWQFIGGLSPLTAIAMLGGAPGINSPDAVRIASLIPAIGFPFLFNNLVVIYRRRIDKAVDAGAPKPSVGSELVLELDEPVEPARG